MSIYPKSVLTKERLALIEFARTVNPTHHVTLNFHNRYAREHAEKKIGRWYSIVNRRLFRRLHLELDKRIDFVAFPEYSLAGYIHYHALARIPATHVAEFARIGESRWKRIVPTSTFHVRPIDSGDDPLENVLSYVTKSTTASDVIHSGMFHNQ